MPLLIFGLSRVVGWVLISVGSHRQVELVEQHNDPIFIFRSMPADPGYLGVITNWDGQWYQSIAVDGYEVPSADDPARDRKLWTWGFPPLFPYAVRFLMLVAHLSYPMAVTVLNISAAALGMVLMYWLLRSTGGSFLAVAGVAVASAFISAPLFQTAYSESLGFLLLMAFFVLLRRRQYGWAMVAVLALGFTRIVTLPLAIVIAVHAFQQYRAHGNRLPRGELAALLALVVTCVLGTLAWLVVASFFIGGEHGLARTQGQRDLYLGWFADTWRFGGPGVFALFLGCVLLLAAHSISPMSRAWGADLRAWAVAYPIYIFAISPIMPGTLRYLLLAPTLPLALVGSPHRATAVRVAGLLVLCALLVVGQWWLVNELLVVASLDQRFSP